MWGQLAFAYLHFLFIILAVTALVWEWVLYQPRMTVAEARRLALVDLFYGISALGLVGSGFARALWFEKEWAFYSANPVFWGKVSAVGLIALLSLPPTLHYLGWLRGCRRGEEPRIAPEKYRSIRRLLAAQMAIFPLVPLLAVLMARGYGL